MSEQLPRLAELFLARGTLEQVVHAMDVLVVEEVRRLHETLVAQIAFERSVCGVFVCASVSHQSILLPEAHLTLITVEGALLGVCALVLAKVRRPFKSFAAGSTAKRSRALRVAGMMKELRRLFKVQLAQVAFEQVLARVHQHVAHQVRAVLKALFTDSALERPLVAVCFLMMLQMRHLAESLVTRVTLEGLLARVNPLVPREF